MASILITGTSTGIGHATALILARAGHQVHATMRRPDRAPELARTATKENLPITVTSLDVDSDSSVKTVLDKILSRGPIDALVNNAGIERTGTIESLPLSEFRAVMETNYFGALRCIQAVAPHMRQRRSGCIINVTSVAGKIASTPLAPYTASKWALEALSEALAQEMKPSNVRVAIVEPGIIDTPMARRIGELPDASVSAQQRRFAALFVETLKHPASPDLVGHKILEIIQSGSWQLRHPVGPDAIPFLEWRRAMTDEQWVDWGAADDDTWYKRVQSDFGLDARPKPEKHSSKAR
jgi:NAD(P)-dependent dehydrogenase (short-subunit alcohol dehydrogenase family)